MVKNGPFRTCFFDRTAKSNIRTADSKREFFDTRPRAAGALVSKKLIVFRPWYGITIFFFFKTRPGQYPGLGRPPILSLFSVEKFSDPVPRSPSCIINGLFVSKIWVILLQRTESRRRCLLPARRNITSQHSFLTVVLESNCFPLISLATSIP